MRLRDILDVMYVYKLLPYNIIFMYLMLKSFVDFRRVSILNILWTNIIFTQPPTTQQHPWFVYRLKRNVLGTAMERQWYDYVIKGARNFAPASKNWFFVCWDGFMGPQTLPPGFWDLLVFCGCPFDTVLLVLIHSNNHTHDLQPTYNENFIGATNVILLISNYVFLNTLVHYLMHRKYIDAQKRLHNNKENAN